jgi:hypothetical protein
LGVLVLTVGAIISAFSGAVLSCAGATGKVLVPGSGSDDLLASDEPPAQPEESQVHALVPENLHIPVIHLTMSDEPSRRAVRIRASYISRCPVLALGPLKI